MNRNKGLIDIHCHILPGVDDGSRNWEMTEQMLRFAYEEGIRTMIATPHYHPVHFKTSIEKSREKFNRVKEMAHEIDEEFEIYLGNELYYAQDAPLWLEEGKVVTMADSDYVLVEFSPGKDYNYIKQGLNNLLMEGYRPILAHIERYRSLFKQYDRVQELDDMGIYLQVNTDSVTGENGYAAKQFIKKILKYQLVHFLGTDSHNLGNRSPKYKKCAELLMKKYEEKFVMDLLYHNPGSIITNENI